MSKIGLFFGPLKGSVHRVAEKVKAAIGEEQIELISVNDASATDLESTNAMAMLAGMKFSKK